MYICLASPAMKTYIQISYKEGDACKCNDLN